MDNENQQDKINLLLDEFREQREQLKQMIEDVDKLRNKLSQMLPDEISNDYRSRNSKYLTLFEEKVKSITEFYNVILSMRKEISATLKNEIELRRKVNTGEETELPDISELASKVADLQKEKDKRKKQVNKNAVNQ